MVHIYFYVEAYYANKYHLLQELNDFCPEIYSGQIWSLDKDKAVRYINTCEELRNGEECFCTEYDVRFRKNCSGIIDVYNTFMHLYALQGKIGTNNKSKIIIERSNTDIK